MNYNHIGIKSVEKFPTKCLDATQEKNRILKRDRLRKISKRLELLLFSSQTSMEEDIQ
jgi:hypothetical protein